MNQVKQQRKKGSPLDGVLVIDKPQGPTSHDVIAQLRKRLGTRRIGHAGTLDPMATGVLVVLLGEATKLSSVLTADGKEYETWVEFGVETLSYDADSPIKRRKELVPGWLEPGQLQAALEQERQRTVQVPPQVSAIRVNGERAHDKVRAGEDFELEPRDVKVSRLELLEQGPKGIRLRLEVSKGYYVRALARDLGAALGVPAHLTQLRRLRSGAFHIEQAQALDTQQVLLPISLSEAARLSLPHLEVSEVGARLLEQGKLLPLSEVLGAIRPPTFGHLERKGGEDLIYAERQGQGLALLTSDRNQEIFSVRRGLVMPTPDSLPLPEGAETR